MRELQQNDVNQEAQDWWRSKVAAVQLVSKFIRWSAGFIFVPLEFWPRKYVFTRVELCRDIFFYHDDGLIKGCDPQKTSSIWSTATTIPILISNQAWFRKKKEFTTVSICQSGPGLPLEILAQEFWVPGSTVRAESPQYLGKELFSEILTVTDETACLYACRASQDPWYTRTMFFIFVVL